MEGPMSKKTKKPPKKVEPQREHQVPEPPPIAKSISNKEREGPFERTPSLEEPSFTIVARLKIETACAHYNTIDRVTYKMSTKLKKEALQCNLLSHHVGTSMKKFIHLLV
jgi:hypothetical protein